MIMTKPLLEVSWRNKMSKASTTTRHNRTPDERLRQSHVDLMINAVAVMSATDLKSDERTALPTMSSGKRHLATSNRSSEDVARHHATAEPPELKLIQSAISEHRATSV